MEHLSSAPIVERSWDRGNMKAVPYILGISQGVVKEMVGYSHTLTRCLSKLRSSLEAGKKQLRVWLQYVCGVTEMLLYPSFRVPLVLLWSHYGDSKMARYRFEDGSKVIQRNMQLIDMCSSTYQTVFDALHIDESKEINIGSSMKSILHSKCNFKLNSNILW
jgi:hypothetical protein